MEGTFLSEMPKFKTPEEELDYLRAHVAKREQELIDKGHFENADEKAVREIVREYKEKPLEKVVHKSNIISKNEAEDIVLNLKPELHDTIMEELLGIVIIKGIRNAISVVEMMANPHIDDDFHRILVQYLKTGRVLDLNIEPKFDENRHQCGGWPSFLLRITHSEFP